ncbi:MAG TPA: DUF4435 domain-containing protein [Bacteroidales bacterium]|nr:DUF4435 domain-containing protein [Bacteroidales bacterium]
MLEYTDESKRLVSTFLAYRNDIDIYTEDEEKDKEFYKVLFSRLIKPEIKINDITPLGCKDKVIERCKNEPKSDRKKLFIVDGDIAFVNGNIVELENLFVLDRYCIENFLIDKESTCNFVYMNCGTKSKEQLSADIEFENWLSNYSESLIQLFIHFAIVNCHGGKFTLFNANKYHSNIGGNYTFNVALVNQDIAILKEEIIEKYGVTSYTEKYNELNAKWTNNIDNFLTIVSGKDYLIPILLIKTQHFKASKSLPSIEEVKINLVQYFDTNNLKKLKEVIELSL